MSEPIVMYFNDFIKLNRGFDLPESNIVGGKYPIAASTSIKDYHKDFKVKAPCVTTGRSGSLGSVLFINHDCWPLNTTLYVKDFKGNNPKYVYYFLQTMKLESFNCGAGVPTLNQNHLHKVKVKIHKKDEQHRIASILSAYDDLIENNNRRIALLELMAEQIYKEWFVRMRFPGYENTEFEKGVPKGWEVKPISTLCSKITDGTHDTPKPIDEGGVPLITGTHIIDGRIDFDSAYKISIDDHTKIKQRSYLDKGDIIFSNIGTIGSIAIVNEDFEYSVKNVIIFKPLSIEYSLFLYYMIKSPSVKEQLLLDSSGTSQKFITLGYIRKVKSVIPEAELIKKYSQLVRPMFLEKSNLQLQTQTLKQTRDLLLPRLISGKLRVEEVEKELEKM